MPDRAQKCTIDWIAMESKYVGKSKLIYTVQDSNTKNNAL